MNIRAAASLALMALSIHSCPVLAQAAPSDYERAVAARLNGDTQSAAQYLRRIVAEQPDNADAQVQLGLTLVALEDFTGATGAFEAALAISPQYDDARIGLAIIAERSGRYQAAAQILQAVDPANPDGQAIRRRLRSAGGQTVWQASLEGTYSTFDADLPEWKELAFQVRRQSPGGHAVAVRGEYARRFEKTDVYGEVAVERVLSSRARGAVTLGATAAPDFRARWQVGWNGSFRLTDGGMATVLTLDARHSAFAAASVQSISTGIEQYLGRGWITARWIHLFDERGAHRQGYFLRGDVPVTENIRLFAGTGKAPDTSEGRVVDVRSYLGGLVMNIGTGQTINLSVAHENRASGFDRTQIGLGIGARF